MKKDPTSNWFKFARVDEAREPIDLRVYKVTIGVVVDLNKSGTDSQIENQIRGISEVTTVRHISQAQKKIGPNKSYREYEIKFELYGAQSRDSYRDLTLVPAIAREVTGATVYRRGQVSKIEAGLSESYAGLAYSTPANNSSPEMPHAPSLTIDGVLADWVEGAVQAYDAPMNTTDMAYHVMVPVEELWELCGRYYRGSRQEFDNRYQNFIKYGSQKPIFVAVGRNRRVKITGNEDDVWFAKKSGLRDLPVFFSYQRQV